MAKTPTSRRRTPAVAAPGPSTADVATTVAQARSAVAALSDGLPETFGVQAASAPNLVDELNGIDFAKLIGGPLQAAVSAQTASSIATINFIKEVGFTKPTDPNETPKLVMADFSYKRKKADDPTQDEEVTLQVPLISIVQVPSIRIESVEIQFNAKLNSVQTENVDEKFGIDGSLGINYGPVNFKVTASYQRNSSTGIKVDKEYTMNVKVRATQDEIPAGLEMVLGKLVGEAG